MSGWRLARSLEVLRAEVNTIAPGRSKVSDGTIGDAAHRGGASDHNPNAAGVVCAIDLTHDPAHGADMHRIAEHIRTRRHVAAKYVIWNRRIASASSGWAWRTYTGSNPHTKHMHVSVGTGPDGKSTGPYDDTSPWGLSTGGIDMFCKLGDKGPVVEAMQRLLMVAGHPPEGGADGDYGPATSRALLAARQEVGTTATSGDTYSPAAYAQLFQLIARRQSTPPAPLPTRLLITGEVTATIPGQARA
ncbi:peptidoglycan-binding protein [Micromonospora sp. KC207]|uniref:peptidoglycan-binding domain-containing protein n=1 Tax=Micromonospora sp. KC207 TaxID=2530377 RepID=UPI0010430C0B|nr:peptidoglycan-binding protein [Micromonospora sp. KC207]TDC63871.1 peptidoglycan-binding protein [Micromonospora sp. KC207]